MKTPLICMTRWALASMSIVAGFQNQLIVGSSAAIAGQASSRNVPAKIFEPLLFEIKKKTHVPILLPSDLPHGVKDAKCASGGADAGGYWVSLDYACPGGANASFAAYFTGTLKSDYYIPQEEDQRVRLARGITGYFSPVSCGGSCAPANLFWQERGVWYHLQLKDVGGPPANEQEEQKQEKTIAAVANSAILAGPR